VPQIRSKCSYNKYLRLDSACLIYIRKIRDITPLIPPPSILKIQILVLSGIN